MGSEALFSVCLSLLTFMSACRQISGLVAEWLAYGLRRSRAWVQIAAVTLF